MTAWLTGKGLNWGGSLVRTEATGYGAVYFAQEMLATRDQSVEGKTATVSGSGNVAQYTVEKLNELGAKAITLSDSGGTIVDKDGITPEKLEWVMELKNVRRGRIREYADHFKGSCYLEDTRPWSVPCDLAFPSATQNEVDEEDARHLVKVIRERFSGRSKNGKTSCGDPGRICSRFRLWSFMNGSPLSI